MGPPAPGQQADWGRASRAFCYIKLGAPSVAVLAEEDCHTVLSSQPDNPKALFRRGQARLLLKVCSLLGGTGAEGAGGACGQAVLGAARWRGQVLWGLGCMVEGLRPSTSSRGAVSGSSPAPAQGAGMQAGACPRLGTRPRLCAVAPAGCRGGAGGLRTLHGAAGPCPPPACGHHHMCDICRVLFMCPSA